MTAAYGIDVSKWQAVIDWRQVASSGKKFAICKATEGTTYKDPRYAANAAGCRSNSIVHGAYHYHRPAFDPEEQADSFFNAVGALRDGDLHPWVDVEVMEPVEGSNHADVLEVAQSVALMVLHCEERFGKPIGIYTSPGFWARFPLSQRERFSHLPLWVAHYTGQAGILSLPSGWNSWGLHQYTSTGRVSGITGNVDLNYSSNIELLQRHILPPDDQLWKLKMAAHLTAIRSELTAMETELSKV